MNYIQTLSRLGYKFPAGQEIKMQVFPAKYRTPGQWAQCHVKCVPSGS